MPNESPETNQLARLTVIIRGLLANAADDEDHPWQPVILKTLTGKEAVDFAASAENTDAPKYPSPLIKGKNPPIFLADIDFTVESEKLRSQLEAEISDYSKQQGGKPEIICLKGYGILYVDNKDDNPKLHEAVLYVKDDLFKKCEALLDDVAQGVEHGT